MYICIYVYNICGLKPVSAFMMTPMNRSFWGQRTWQLCSHQGSACSKEWSSTVNASSWPWRPRMRRTAARRPPPSMHPPRWNHGLTSISVSNKSQQVILVILKSGWSMLKWERIGGQSEVKQLFDVCNQCGSHSCHLHTKQSDQHRSFGL